MKMVFKFSFFAIGCFSFSIGQLYAMESLQMMGLYWMILLVLMNQADGGW